jgi:transcriptional regulator GlxA family with amidase domain
MRIAILASSDVPWLDLFGPMEVFLEAAKLCERPGLYDVEVIGTAPGWIGGPSGVRVLPCRTIADTDAPIDTLLVAGGPEPVIDQAVVAWLADQVGQVRRCGSVSTGSFLLAAAGLLDGRRVAAHWQHAERLAALFPRLAVDPDPIFVKDGKFYTSAGVTAALDLALALVEEDVGSALALEVARRLVMFLKRPGSQSQVSTHLAAQLSSPSATQQVRQWILANLTQDLSVETLARRASMSARNFSRVFRREVGMTPAEFVEAARVDTARRELEDTDLPLKRIAARSGFSGTDAMRGAFYRRVGVTANRYRAMFRDDLRGDRNARRFGPGPNGIRQAVVPGLEFASQVSNTRGPSVMT